MTLEVMQEGDEEQVPWSIYQSEIEGLCSTKADEFHLLGYDKVTPQEVWECVQSTFKGTPRLHEVVAFVLGLRVNKFMNYMTMSAYKGALGEDVFSRHS